MIFIVSTKNVMYSLVYILHTNYMYFFVTVYFSLLFHLEFKSCREKNQNNVVAVRYVFDAK